MLSDAIQQSAPGLLLAGVVALVLTLGFAKLRENSKIRKLGGRAKNLQSFTIFFGISRSPFHHTLEGVALPSA